MTNVTASVKTKITQVYRNYTAKMSNERGQMKVNRQAGRSSKRSSSHEISTHH